MPLWHKKVPLLLPVTASMATTSPWGWSGGQRQFPIDPDLKAIVTVLSVAPLVDVVLDQEGRREDKVFDLGQKVTLLNPA